MRGFGCRVQPVVSMGANLPMQYLLTHTCTATRPPAVLAMAHCARRAVLLPAAAQPAAPLTLRIVQPAVGKGQPHVVPELKRRAVAPRRGRQLACGTCATR